MALEHPNFTQASKDVVCLLREVRRAFQEQQVPLRPETISALRDFERMLEHPQTGAPDAAKRA